jgi:transmembrane sensor
MNQYDFDQVLKKYISGEQSPEDEKFIQEYLESNPMNESAVFENEKEQIGKRIRKKLYASTIDKPLEIRLKPWYTAIAASILILLGCWYFLSGSVYKNILFEGRTAANPGVIEVKNTSDKSQDIPLEDGSIVTLKKNSSLSFPEHFGTKNRLVYLHGEAFFKIKRNPDKPFIVSTGNLITQVLGTSFTVKSYDEARSIEVRVASGRVSVYEKSDKTSKSSNGVILTPNQRMVFDKKSRKMELSIVDRPAVISKQILIVNPFSFSDSPFKDALSVLEKAYGIDIVVESNIPDTCLFNGDLSDLSMFEQLDLICKSVNATYETRGTTVFVQGAGCQP